MVKPQDGSIKSEVWKDIPGYKGLYQVSDIGNVKSVPRFVNSKGGSKRLAPGYLLKQHINTFGYPTVSLSKGGHRKTKTVHGLIMLAFVGEPPVGKVVCHNDGNPRNSNLENLRYDTVQSNAIDTINHGGNYQSNKTECPYGHLLVLKNIRPDGVSRGKRGCLACSRARNRIRRHPDLEGEFQEISDSYYQAIMV